MRQNKSFDYVSKFKYFMLVPIVIALLSIILGAIFNFNLDYDFRKISNFTVKFNTTVTETEYQLLEDKIDAILEDNDFEDYRLERIGSGAKNGVFVKIANDNNELDSQIVDVKTFIEDNLLSSVDGIESSVVISTSDVGFALPKNVTSLIWLSLLSAVCIIALVFFYVWIRYNFIAGCSLATTLLIEIGTLIASLIVFRIPLNTYFVIPFVVMILLSVIFVTFINNFIKSTLNNEVYIKQTNSDKVRMATRKLALPISIFALIVAMAILVVMFFGGPSLIYIGLAVILSLIIAVLSSLFVYTSLWSFWYKRDKDNVLKRRIEAEKNREEIKAGKKPDDKLVV